MSKTSGAIWLTMATLAVVLATLLTACGAGPTSAFVSPLATSPAEESAAAGGAGLQPTARVLPTPGSAGLATVGGVLRLNQPGGAGSPKADAQLYLAGVIRSTEGKSLVAGFDEKSSPSARTDANGTFVFVDVPPDTYALAISTPMGSVVIQGRDGKDLLFEVKAGMRLDLGELRTDFSY